MRIIDSHVHCSPSISAEELDAFLTKTNTDGAVIQAVAHSRDGSLVPIGFRMKKNNPGKYWVFGAPSREEYFKGEDNLGKRQKEYIRVLAERGLDGVKLLEGKPQMRKTVPIPDFDSKCWDEFFAYLEDEQMPVTWHVNDPETNWNSNASPWLIKQGWAYDDSYINNEEQYRQVIEVLEHHPGLRIVFAHFFFMSAQLERLSGIMDRYENIMVDLTPGIEMFENFSSNIIEAKAFFKKYHNRICYGTDIGGRCILTNEGEKFNYTECLRRPEIVRYFISGTEEKLIEPDGDFLIQRKPFVMRPLGLSENDAEEIFSKNIIRQIGREPKSVCDI